MKQKDFYNSRAWYYCSKYVLLFYSNNGMVQCSTCGNWYEVNNRNIQCGHLYKSDSNRSVALDFHNLAPQCYKCNVYFSGMPDKMHTWLLDKHGFNAMQKLIVKKNIPKKLDAYDLTIIKDEYKLLFNELVKTKGNPWK